MKKALKIILVLLVIVILHQINVRITKNAIEECVANGNNYNFCVNTLK